MNRFTSLSVSQLQEGCQNHHKIGSQEGFCVELFRRAIANQSQHCWSAIHQQYERLIYHWTAEYMQSNPDPSDAYMAKDVVKEIAIDAFSAFWRAYTQEKLAKAKGLGSILCYLKSCVASSVDLKRRHVQRHQYRVMDWEPSAVNLPMAKKEHVPSVEQEVIQKMEADALWRKVEDCCHDDKEHLVARQSLISNLKPRQILESHPDIFDDISEIYNISRNLRNRISRLGYSLEREKRS